LALLKKRLRSANIGWNCAMKRISARLSSAPGC
jgi:hypothetical protein